MYLTKVFCIIYKTIREAKLVQYEHMEKSKIKGCMRYRNFKQSRIEKKVGEIL